VKETLASMWPGPGRKLQRKSQRTWVRFGVRGDSCKIPSLVAGGKSQTANESAQHLCGVIVAALYESTKPVAAKGRRNIVVFHSMTASTRPCVGKGRERADSHANAGGVLEGLVAQAKAGGVGDWVEPHAAGPGRNAVEKSPTPVGGSKAL
jgi:hypothetical protein